jgi:arginase
VQVYDMDRIRQAGGLRTLLHRVVASMRRRCRHYGITIDLDAVDPQDAPGVGVPVAGGLSGRTLCRALKGLGSDPALVGLEIAEFNPLRDQQHRTERLVEELIGSIYGARWHRKLRCN